MTQYLSRAVLKEETKGNCALTQQQSN